MRPIKDFLDALVSKKEFVVNPQDAYTQVIWALEQRLGEFDKEVWNPRLKGPEYEFLKKRREQVMEDLEVVRTMAHRLAGHPKPPERSPVAARRPDRGYGEP